MSGKYSASLRRLWPFGLAALALLLNLVFAQFPSIVESLYSRGFYPLLTRVLSAFSALLPISLTELFAVGVILGFLASLAFVFTRRIPFRKWLYLVGSAAAILFAWFSFGWGYNYLRPPLLQTLNVARVDVDSTAFRGTVDAMVAALNESFVNTAAIDTISVNRAVEAGYLALAAKLPLSIPGGRRPVKRLFVNAVLNKTLTSGFFSPFFHEIHLNADLLPVEYPFILAHEKAHQMGFANEAEASFLAWLVCVQSGNPMVRYSGHFAISQRFLGRSRFVFSDYKSVYESVRTDVRDDFRKTAERYRRHQGRISQMSSKAYDQYLKANRISEGVANYGGVVDLVLQWELGTPAVSPPVQ